MEDFLQGIELRLQKLALKLKRIEAENEIFRQENDALKAKVLELEQQLAVLPASVAPDADVFTTNVNNARKTKRELELYLREMERKLEEIRF
jgi:predicted RNase H-like nuclease (RuvC/YqgF family)